MLPTEPLYNIHRILNEFEKYFPYKRESTKFSMISNREIFFQAVYGHITLDESKMSPDWNSKYEIEEIRKLGKRENVPCIVMMRLYVTRNTKDHFTNEPYDLRLYKDNIYINPYVMPDYDMAKQFFEARKQMTSCRADLLVSCWHIKLSTRQITQIRKAALAPLEQSMHELSKGIVPVLNGKNPPKDSAKHLDQLMKNVESSIHVMRFLMFGPYGSGNPAYNAYFKENQQYSRYEYPDFNIYNKE